MGNRWLLGGDPEWRLCEPAPHASPRRVSAPASSMTRMPSAADNAGAWVVLRARVRARTPGLLVPPAAGRGLCACCRGPARPGYARCFHCELHAESAPGLLADVVVPVAYAPKGGAMARDLWLYKSARPEAAAAGAALLALLLVFLHDRAPLVWQRTGLEEPSHVCVVPSGRGRPGPHPLRALVARYLALPWAKLVPMPGADRWVRCLDPDRFGAPGPLRGARVLLLDDTWVSGGAAQSAALALKRAGCRSVTTVVLGRHLAAGCLPPLAVRWDPAGQ